MSIAYTLVPNVGKDIKLVDISDLPKSIPPPRGSGVVTDNGPEWKKALECWNRIYAYYRGPGRSWKPNCDLYDQFYVSIREENARMSGIFLFMSIYKDLTTDPKAPGWTDDEIRDKIMTAVIGGRAHAIFPGSYRVWDEWKEPDTMAF